MNKMTPSLEDYLENIYFIYLKNSIVRVTDLALEMGISKPSVSKAMNILKKNGYVNQEPYGHLSLTDEGKKLAKAIANRHRTLKRFFLEVVGVDEEAAEADACSIEHLISEETFEKIEKFMVEYLS